MNCKLFLLKSVIIGLLALSSCSDSDNALTPSIENDSPKQVNQTAEFSMADLNQIASNLEQEGYDVSEIMERIKENTPQTKFLANIIITSKKISVAVTNPNDSTKTINVSGILMYPKLHWFKTRMKLIVATPGTYTDNKLAPSVMFNNLVTWQKSILDGIAIAPYILNAGENPILIIDYPGFGDSNGKVQHPYLDRQALATTSIQLIREAKKELKKADVQLSREAISITGYSQGGFVATAIAREIETNPNNQDITIRLLSVGGAPVNLNEVLNKTIEKGVADVPYFFPYGIWGYKKGRYPNIPVEKIVKEPYYSISKYDFTGRPFNFDYPAKMSDIYDEYFLKNYKTDPQFAELRKALDEGDVQPWVNKMKFIMYHGTSDTTVDYYQAEEYAKKQNKLGGKVEFKAIPLATHTLGAIPFWVLSTRDINRY